MNLTLQKKYNLLESKTQELIDSLNNIPLETLNYRPGQDKWSIIQIIFHLVKTERITEVAISNSVKHSENLREAGFKESISSTILNLALKSPLKIKAPALLIKIPETYDLNELIKKWKTVRENLFEILNDFPVNLINKNVFEHPYSSKMNISQTLDFLRLHLCHHLKQVEKIQSDFRL